MEIVSSRPFQMRRGKVEAKPEAKSETKAADAGARGGKDPFMGRTGDFERHYVLPIPPEQLSLL